LPKTGAIIALVSQYRRQILRRSKCLAILFGARFKIFHVGMMLLTDYS